jgi:hypothetical protein
VIGKIQVKRITYLVSKFSWMVCELWRFLCFGAILYVYPKNQPTY